MALIFDDGEGSAREIRALMPLFQKDLQYRFDLAQNTCERKEVIKEGIEITGLVVRSGITPKDSAPQSAEPKEP